MGIIWLVFGGWAAACRHLPPSPSSPAADTPRQPHALKILVSADGFYRLPLAEAPFPPDNGDVSWQTISLTTAGEPVPYLLAEDALIFYGLAPSSRYTKYQPYLLTWGGAAVAQTHMASAAAQPAGGAASFAASATHRLQFTENVLYESAAAAANSEPWFWHTIQVSQSLSLPLTLPPLANSQGQLWLQLWGATTHEHVSPDHDLDVLLNGQWLQTIRWDGQRYYTAALVLPAGSLRSGGNILTLDNSEPGATWLDISLLDWVEISFSAPTQAVDDWFDGYVETAAPLHLTGFTAPPFVFDITDPRQPRQLAARTAANNTTQVVAAAGAHIAAVGPAGWRQPAAIVPVQISAWRQPENQADMIIIAGGAELLPALAPLVAARQSQGLRVAQLTVETIYDEFGAGMASPESIRTFLTYAMTTWTPPSPRYLLLVGEATTDYRDYLSQSPANLIPPLLVPTALGGETISDVRLADVDADGQPDLAVGRWPATNPEAVAALAQRTLAYEQAAAAGQTIFITENDEFTRFAEQVMALSQFAPAHLARLYGAAPDQAAQAWNQGAWLVAYAGHGSLSQWGQAGILNVDGVGSLQSQPPPIVLQFTCLTGFFAHPAQDSLSEALLRHAHGPALVVGPTSLTLSANQEAFAANLLAALQDPTALRMGDAMQQARRDLNLAFDSLQEISDTFALLGDPATLIRRPPP